MGKMMNYIGGSASVSRRRGWGVGVGGLQEKEDRMRCQRIRF